MTIFTRCKLLLFYAVLLVSGIAESAEDVKQEAVNSAAPISMISSFIEESSSSKTLRILKPALEEYLQRPIEITYNSSRQGGAIGARMAAAAPPEQLTIFIGTVGNVALLPGILSGYDVEPLRDFRPVSLLTMIPDVLIVRAGLGINSLDELVAYATNAETPLSYSYIAPVSIHRMEFLQLFDDLGIDAEVDSSIVGSPAAMAAISSGAIDLTITTVPYVISLVEQGLAVPLAVASEKRVPAFPDVPTMQEAGIDYPHGSWAGALVPAATSDENLVQLFRALDLALMDPELAAQIAELGMIATPSSSPEIFASFIEDEIARLDRVARKFDVMEE